MTPLIAMPGPWLPEAIPGREPDSAILPPLPYLSRLLQRGRRLPDAPDWRAAVLQALGLPSQLPPAVVAARATGLAAGEALCFAAPLHLVAGMSRVHLAPGGRLRFDAEEESLWREAFNAEFASSGVSLLAAAPAGGWMLSAPFAAAARDVAPEGLDGAPLERRAAQGAQEKALRRLAAESEMWLAAHPLNRRREAGGAPAFNALWFWGGAQVQVLPALRRPLQVIANGTHDAWLGGLAAHAAVEVRCAGDFTSALQSIDRHADGDVLLVPAVDADAVPLQQWQGIEEQWIEPAMRAVEDGRIAGLRVQIGAAAWQWPVRGFAAWLRRDRRSWWQIAGVAR